MNVEGRPNGLHTEASFSQGGGQCGALIRSLDWRAMPLGPLAQWPQSLRTAVSMCLSSRFPIAIYWGPEFVMLYNDALLPMVGANKHPLSFGRPAFEVLPEIRELIEPLLSRVLAGGEAVLAEDMMLPLLRQEVPEESYFTFTYSAIRVESGDVGGVLCAVVETTDKVIEGRRLRLLNALAGIAQAKSPDETCAAVAERVAGAASDIPFALLYLLDESLGTATLAGTANVDPDTPLSPRTIAAGDPSLWPFDPTRTQAKPHFMDLASGPAGSRGAVILAFERSGGGAPLGFMVVGLSSKLRRTPSYDLFHRLLAGSVSQAISHAAAYQTQLRATKELKQALDRAERSEARLEREHDGERLARRCAELGARVGRAFVGAEPLGEQLRQCCDAIVTLGAALARIWTYDPNREALELQASAGMYTHIDGAHARVPLGSLKIGRIAASRQPHLTNAVAGDPHVADQEWAKREGLVAFAGYPLLVEDKLMGVVALFAKEPLSAATFTALSSVADQIALGIERDASERFRELFIGMLGHDLRNPLNAIFMGGNLLALKVSPPEARIVTRILNSSKRMDRMIAQVLDFTRARSGGGIPIVRTSADLAAVSARVVDELALGNPQRSIETTNSVEAHGWWDVDRLEQVFSNLVANALAYGRAETPIHVSMSLTPDAVHWVVRNEGNPIPAELLPHLFDPFRRARHVRVAGTQGLGLGLFISREIVKAHGGTISVESNAETGTRFAIALPGSLR